MSRYAGKQSIHTMLGNWLTAELTERSHTVVSMLQMKSCAHREQGSNTGDQLSHSEFSVWLILSYENKLVKVRGEKNVVLVKYWKSKYALSCDLISTNFYNI